MTYTHIIVVAGSARATLAARLSPSNSWARARKEQLPPLDIRTIAALTSLVIGVAIACGGSVTVTPTPSPSPTQVSAEAEATPAQVTPVPRATETPTPAPEATPVTTPTPLAYNSNRAMYEIFPRSVSSPDLIDATLDAIVANKDTSLAPVLIEFMRFVPAERLAETLQSLTGQPFGTRDWFQWMEWLGQNLDAYQPPSRYPEWKAALYANLSERFAAFLAPASEFTRIDLTEIVWGGVLPDGIPDLQNPKTLQAADADYLNPDDRVFGVNINGETRAYPLRIVNAHEMVNDSLGGEPISLMW